MATHHLPRARLRVRAILRGVSRWAAASVEGEDDDTGHHEQRNDHGLILDIVSHRLKGADERALSQEKRACDRDDVGTEHSRAQER